MVAYGMKRHADTLLWMVTSGAGRIFAHGMKLHAPTLLSMVTSSCWNGARRIKINAHEINGHATMLPCMVTLSCWNGAGRINVHGMKERADKLLRTATLSCWNGLGWMVALGTKTHMKVHYTMEILPWHVIWKMKDAQCSNQMIHNNDLFLLWTLLSSSKHLFLFIRVLFLPVN